MSQIRYSLLREGSSDQALSVLLERYGLLRGHNLMIIEDASKPFNGPLGRVAIRIRTTDSFLRYSADMIFVFTDNDKGTLDKKTLILEAIGSLDELYLDKTVVGIPNPHMEAWLLGDQDTVKHLLRLDGSKPLPFGNLEPKKQLEKLFQNYGSEDLTPPIGRTKLAEQLNIENLKRRDPSFKAFCETYDEILNKYSA